MYHYSTCQKCVLYPHRQKHVSHQSGAISWKCPQISLSDPYFICQNISDGWLITRMWKSNPCTYRHWRLSWDDAHNLSAQMFLLTPPQFLATRYQDLPARYRAELEVLVHSFRPGASLWDAVNAQDQQKTAEVSRLNMQEGAKKNLWNSQRVKKDSVLTGDWLSAIYLAKDK